jgi:hypothetical protein
VAFVIERQVIEQRKTQRFDLTLPFELVGGGADQTSGETRNVSSSGVLFTVSTPIRIGELIEYVITLTREPPSEIEVRLRCSGMVVREASKSTYAATIDRHEFMRPLDQAGLGR